MAAKKIDLDRSPILNDPRTLVAAELAYEGFTHDTIRRKVRLTIGQVGYRLGKLGVSTAEVRRGIGEEAQQRMNRVLAKHGFVTRGPRNAAGGKR